MMEAELLEEAHHREEEEHEHHHHHDHDPVSYTHLDVYKRQW